jgi:microcystin degradation protein MlrC
MARPRRLLVSRLWFEGNRFAPATTRLEAFQRVEWVRGEPALAAFRGAEHELAAVAAFAASRSDWQVRVSRCAAAWPGGPIEDPVFGAYCDELLQDIEALQPDAMYMSLHGAAITTRLQAPETLLLQRVRTALGTRPLVASLDLHANLDPSWATLLDFGSAYRSYPHVDLRSTAARVLSRLDALCRGERLHGHAEKLGALLPSFRMRSDEAPMAALLAQARALELSEPGSDVSILGGFPYADTPHADAGVMAWAPQPEAAARLAGALLVSLRARQAQFQPQLRSAADGLDEALGLLQQRVEKPVAVTDPADNPLSGGCADTPALMHALLCRRARLPAEGVVFAYFCDPALVQRARSVGIGAALEGRLGGRRSAAFGAPLAVQARVRGLSDGSFVNQGPMQQGQTVHCGPGALLDVQGIAVIVTSTVLPANDPGFFAHHGIDLQRTRLLCVKAKNHFHAAFAPRCAAIIEVDVPGPAAADLSRLPFAHWPGPSPAASRA